jgi:thiamine biosynthesis lipoprotein
MGGTGSRAPRRCRLFHLAAAGLVFLSILFFAAWQAGLLSRATEAYADRFLTTSDAVYVMGAYLQITATGRGAEKAVALAVARFQELDILLNPANPASDMASLTAAAGYPVSVSPDTIAVLERADAVYRLSGGAFDMTVGPLVDLWGFGPQSVVETGAAAGGGRATPPSEAEIEIARRLVGWQRVQWDRAAGTAMLLAPELTLATGGIAKGYALDEAARILRESGVRRAIIDAGGSLYLLGAKTTGRPWRIALRHPRQEGYLGILELPADLAVATSGDYQRYFEADGRRYHHLIDPATGRPAISAMSVTVVGPSAVDADALSTALFVLGPGPGLALALTLPGLEALFVDAAGNITMTPGMAAWFVPAGASAADSDRDPTGGGGIGSGLGRLTADEPGLVTRFVVEVAGVRMLQLDPNVDGLYAVQGPLGETRIEIRDGRAIIRDSPCPRPAWHGGWLDRRGQVSVCLPNRVVLMAQGAGQSGAGQPFDDGTR